MAKEELTLWISMPRLRPESQEGWSKPIRSPSFKEQTAIAADPYDAPEKAKIFSVDFAAHGLLPIFFVITNDGDQPISIANMGIKLITANHSKLTPITIIDL